MSNPRQCRQFVPAPPFIVHSVMVDSECARLEEDLDGLFPDKFVDV